LVRGKEREREREARTVLDSYYKHTERERERQTDIRKE